jgi:hypothetical protein
MARASRSKRCFKSASVENWWGNTLMATSRPSACRAPGTLHPCRPHPRALRFRTDPTWCLRKVTRALSLGRGCIIGSYRPLTKNSFNREFVLLRGLCVLCGGKLLRPGMRAVVHLEHLLHRELGVFLRRGEAFVPQHFLDGFQVGALSQQVSAERVSQGVGMDVGR